MALESYQSSHTPDIRSWFLRLHLQRRGGSSLLTEMPNKKTPLFSLGISEGERAKRRAGAKQPLLSRVVARLTRTLLQLPAFP